MRSLIVDRAGLLASLLAAGVLYGAPALATDGGASLYLLGKRGPVAGLIPKPGWYLTNDVYYYDASADAQLPLGGTVSSGVDVEALVNIAQVTWVTDRVFGDARLALGAVLPYGNVDVSAVASTPAGGGVTVARSDSTTAVGDLALAASLGWRKRVEDKFRAWSVYSTVFAPTGSWEEGRIANTGKNRWGLDLGGAFTLGNFKRGRELSGVLGFTVNGDNEDTDYESGTEMHLEMVYKQHLPSGFSGGIVGYYGRQLSADSGAPAALGDFKGEVAAIGPELAYQFKVGERSVGLSLRWYSEFAVENRVEGDAVFLTLSAPLTVGNRADSFSE